MSKARAGLRAVVHAADGLQVPVVEALHADRQARDAGGAKGGEALALEGARVGLQRDLAGRLQRQAGAHAGDQAVDLRRLEQAGRAAADEHAVDGAAPDERQAGFQIGHQRIDVARLLRGGVGALAPLVRVEIAVGALADAPRQVHVQRQRRQRWQLQRAGTQVVRDVVHRRGAQQFTSIIRAACARCIRISFRNISEILDWQAQAAMNIESSVTPASAHASTPPCALRRGRGGCGRSSWRAAARQRSGRTQG